MIGSASSFLTRFACTTLSLLLLLLLSLAGTLTAAGQQRQVFGQEPPSSREIKQWVEDLGADQFFLRDAASRKLKAAGAAAVGPVGEALSGRELEVSMRAASILQQLAVSGDFDTERAARKALEKVAELRVTAAARRAQDALDKLPVLRQQRALDVLEHLGARLERQHEETGLPAISDLAELRIANSWRGTDQDLERLKWLIDVDQITFEGKRVDPKWIRHVEKMPNVSIVKIKRVKINDQTLVHLTKLIRLHFVKLLYVPVTNDGLEHIKKCQQLEKVMLYGTKVTEPGADRLRRAMVAEVDRRDGAFLGISPSHLGANWFIRTITVGSAAENAEIRAGDMIVSYDGQEVADFSQLTALISKHPPGSTVPIGIRRGNLIIEKKITLGEWD
ncbi:MAG TPA: PDZ domain-containing protein [Pirellulaceae bacterium]|jgi:hypothetical protein|nr:PDZ domain-containing protein [Pirellulaceae bacterium]